MLIRPTVLAGRITTLDEAGNAANDQKFGYDAADRLTAYAGPPTARAYTYDANGNRSSQRIAGMVTDIVMLANNVRKADSVGRMSAASSAVCRRSASPCRGESAPLVDRGPPSQSLEAHLGCRCRFRGPVVASMSVQVRNASWGGWRFAYPPYLATGLSDATCRRPALRAPFRP